MASNRDSIPGAAAAGAWELPAAADVLDALASHIVILDAAGTIVHCNRAWRKFAEANGGRAAAHPIGTNYLNVCRAAEGADAASALRAAAGIRAILRGERPEFLMEYPCHSPTAKRWFHMRVTRLLVAGSPCALLSHENVTDLKEIQEQLERDEAQLRQQAEELAEANVALKVLLQQRERDRLQLEEEVLGNVQKRVLPYLEQLRRLRLDAQQQTVLAQVEASLRELTSPFVKRLGQGLYELTPRELEVATLVRDGHSNKEIASFLGLSERAVEFHRANLRKKLGLHQSGTNLRSFLLSLDR